MHFSIFRKNYFNEMFQMERRLDYIKEQFGNIVQKRAGNPHFQSMDLDSKGEDTVAVVQRPGGVCQHSSIYAIPIKEILTRPLLHNHTFYISFRRHCYQRLPYDQAGLAPPWLHNYPFFEEPAVVLENTYSRPSVSTQGIGPPRYQNPQMLQSLI